MSGCIHHISLTCHSLNDSQRFYSQFGFSIEKKYEDSFVSIVLMSADNGAKLELFHFNSSIKSVSNINKNTSEFPTLKKNGITHFALSVDDIDKYHRFFSNADYCSEIRQARLGHFVYFFTVDPDGNQIEIIMEDTQC